jgi:CBS domain containing-hemolysin-like protein
MNGLDLSLLVIVLLVVGSAFFSGTEVAMFSLRQTDRAQMSQSGRSGDQVVLRLLGRPRRLIATLLIGNESVNVSMSAVMAGVVGHQFPGLGEIERALVAIAFALPLLLFIGEITPKVLAIRHPVSWSRRVVRPLSLFYVLVGPVRFVVRGLADLIALPFGGGTSSGPRDLSEADFRALVDAGSAEGQVAAEERRIIHRVFEFGDKTVAEAMRPRPQIFALSYDLALPRLVKEVAARGFTRVPVYLKNLDDVRGILHAKDLVAQGSGIGAPRRLAELLHEPLFVPQTTRLDRLLRLFKQNKTHMALVVNEYGKVAGLVTLEDLLEQLFGAAAPTPPPTAASTPSGPATAEGDA